MPTGIYKRTEYHRNILKGRKRNPMSEDTKKKIGDKNRGKSYHNFGFKIGNNFGNKRCSEETKRKIGLGNSVPKIELICKLCKRTKMVLPFYIKYHKFCSIDCYRKYNTKDKHYAWKGGVSTLRDLIRRTKNYRDWRFQVFKRDNFTCKICKKTKEVSRLLEADHIKPFSKIRDENKLKELNDYINCKELWDINNGRTLCHDCHVNTPTYGGKSKL